MAVSSRKTKIILETAKCQELLRLIPILQCHHCKDVPGPKEKNRYSCIDSSHTLCEKDKLKCPCRSLVGKNPSPIIAKLLEDLPWMCQNYKRGCREIEMTVSGLEIHQRKCIFRKVYCPKLACSMDLESRNIELLFKDVMEHIFDSHSNDSEISKIAGETNVWTARLRNSRNFEQRHKDNSICWSKKMTSACGAVFFFEAWMIQNTIHCWVNFLGSLDDAKNFTVNFSVSNNARETFIYDGPVHTLDKKQFDILEEQSCFLIKLDAVRRCLSSKSRFHIMITIKNLKEKNEGEDNGESEDSEEKPTVKKRRRR